jgi:hypothetical protein
MNGLTTSYFEDLAVDPSALSPDGVIAHLDGGIANLMKEIEESQLWSIVTDPATSDILVREILKEIYLEIVMYQPEAIEGAVRAIAQFPRQMPVAYWDEMLHHQVEEFDHGEMALRDYKGFGGDEAFARARIQSPSSFAVAAVWNHFAHKKDPFMYLGAVYLFDGLTPIVTQRAGIALSGRKLSANGLEFITHHATADIAHADQIKKLIIDVLEKYPDKKSSVVYGFEYFRQVYPLPCWNAALKRASMSTLPTQLAAE